ncbi:MAG: heavy metal translocating P-type ATPase [Planctomyces sp.]|nr:heavy metal translocating P-type ATPase [Planctomyces sp.]MBA4119837.1 heavy metal translocating P-type ATPase [Isosphaera sp.]
MSAHVSSLAGAPPASGPGAEPPAPGMGPTPARHQPQGPQSARRWLAWLTSARGELWSAIVAGVLLAGAWTLSLLGASGDPLHATLVWGSLGIGLVHGARAAWGSLAQRRFDIDVLMLAGALAAAFIGSPGEGALLLFLFTLSGALEELAGDRTRRAVEALHRLMPTEALRLDQATGLWGPVKPELLGVGDRVRVPSGERVPADCTLVLGQTEVDQSSLTGESMPRAVSAADADELFAGSINAGDPIECLVRKPAGESSLRRVLDLVTVAQSQREPAQRLIDRLSQPYSVGVAAAAGLAFVGFWLIGARPPGEALSTAIFLLIVASPCALIIATPTATLAGISRGARCGVLFKGGLAAARLAGLRAVAFDKTGTLTIGRPRVVEVHPVAWSDADRLLAVAAALEAHSSHPIAAAVAEAAAARRVTPAQAADVRQVAGRGMTGTIGAAEARLGSLAHAEELVPVCLRARVRQSLERVRARGRIAVVCAHDGQAGVLILEDAVRPGAECLVERLHAAGVRPVVMLTGDHADTARRVAGQLGLDRFHAELLPEDKLGHVRQLRADLGRGARGVGVIGDGVNDAPALAAADVSIAIGSIGSDAALESADIVLLSDDLSAVPWALGLARRIRRTIALNLGFALGAIVLMAAGAMVAAALGISLPLWAGVVGHEGGTLLVVGHSLLLLAYPGVPLCARTKPRSGVELRLMGKPLAA